MRSLLARFAAGRRTGSSRTGPSIAATFRRRSSRLVLGVALAGMTSAAVLVPSQIGASPVKASSGFSNGEVRLASSFPLNFLPTQMYGIQAYFNYQNKKFGGVKMANGKKYKIVFKYLTDAYTAARGLANVKTFIATFHPAAIVGLLGSATNQAVISTLDSAKIPDLYSIEGDDYWQENVGKFPMFGATSQPSDNLWVESELNFVKNKFPHAKIAMLLQNTAYGQDVQAAVTKDIKGTGLQVVATQLYPVEAPTVSTQIATLANSGANVFLDFSLTPALTEDIEYMQTIGWHPAHFICYNCANTTALGPAGTAANGIYAPLAFVTPTAPQWSSLPQIVSLKSLVKTYGPSGTKVDESSLEGASIGQLCVENLEKSQPTSASLLHVVENQHGSAYPLLIPGFSVNTSPTYPYLVNQLRIAEYNQPNNRWVYRGPVYTDPTYKR